MAIKLKTPAMFTCEDGEIGLHWATKGTVSTISLDDGVIYFSFYGGKDRQAFGELKLPEDFMQFLTEAFASPDHDLYKTEAFASPDHDLYKTGDADAPDCVKDRNGEVVLGMCRTCGKAENMLGGECLPQERTVE